MLSLLKKESRQQTVQWLQCLVAVIRNNSSSSERRHSIGLETKPAKARGVGLEASMLQARTYQVQAIRESDTHTEKAMRHYCKLRGMTFQKMKGLLRGSTVQASAQRKRKRVASRERRCRRTQPVKLFRDAHWFSDAKLGSVAWKAEEQRIAVLWRRLPAGRKQVYVERAAAVDRVKRECEASLNVREIEASALSSFTKAALKRRAAYSVLNDVRQDPWWSTSVACDSSALAPQHVDMEKTQEQIRHLFEKHFAYDGQPVPNPGVRQPFRPCTVRNCGLCTNNPMTERLLNAVWNIHETCRQHRITRARMPLLLDIKILGFTSTTLLVDCIGKAEMQLFTSVVQEEEAADAERFYRLDVDWEGEAPIPWRGSSQEVLGLLVGSAAQRLEREPVDVEDFDFTGWEPEAAKSPRGCLLG